ncbi:MAG: M20/M25/M40 family metallo-hydrolase [Acidobacteria bacterium]|jgi:acetylornithine deacetylase|nr:MAG: M20/M25/M40 family metallo-hydrolase [Acidobacteriota bacterium]GIU81204.1 MAG: acetylornithine deacetylase [Pyrinomonadaceae bacterium]
MDVFELTIELMKIPSVSGQEERIGYFLRDYLKSLGWQVELQSVSETQNNVIAYLDESPKIFLSTHMDTVPPFIPPQEDDEKIYGRGACDAKGIIASQIIAAETLRKEGIREIGLLFTVDEEQSSTGAKAANLHPIAQKCEYLINGEPTDNYLAIGSKGSLRLFIKTKGKAAHSAYPEEGESAIEKLLDILQTIRDTEFPSDEFFGETTVNIGTISGGLKTNIIAPFAEAGLHIRLVTDEKPILEILEKAVCGRGEIEVMTVARPVKMLALDGFSQKVVRFTTDIPHLTNWGKPLLLGPGSILVAHTDGEYVMKKDLLEAVELYIRMVKKLSNLC